jgi:hypothetical protein
MHTFTIAEEGHQRGKLEAMTIVIYLTPFIPVHRKESWMLLYQATAEA